MPKFTYKQMARAFGLHRSSKLELERVARRLGLNSVSHMTKNQFRVHLAGISPTEESWGNDPIETPSREVP